MCLNVPYLSVVEYVQARLCRSTRVEVTGDSLPESVLSFHSVDSGDKTPVVGLTVGACRYLLSHLVSSEEH